MLGAYSYLLIINQMCITEVFDIPWLYLVKLAIIAKITLLYMPLQEKYRDDVPAKKPL